MKRIKIEITLDIDDPKKEHEAIIMLSDSVGYLGDLVSVKTTHIEGGTYTGRMSMRNPNLSTLPPNPLASGTCPLCSKTWNRCTCKYSDQD